MEALDSDLVYDDDFDHWSNVGEQDLLCLKVQKYQLQRWYIYLPLVIGVIGNSGVSVGSGLIKSFEFKFEGRKYRYNSRMDCHIELNFYV